MKRWKTIPALLALIALMMPCAHAAAHHHHDECVAEPVCVAEQASCHACTDTACPEKPEILPGNSMSPVDVPERPLFVVDTLRTDEQLAISVALPAAALLALQTVQLLI
jgi:hypothetical protein